MRLSHRRRENAEVVLKEGSTSDGGGFDILEVD